jgi:hypothetical protein
LELCGHIIGQSDKQPTGIMTLSHITSTASTKFVRQKLNKKKNRNTLGVLFCENFYKNSRENLERNKKRRFHGK